MDDGQNIDASEAGRALAAKRQIVEGTCEVCDKSFTGTRKRKYCSHACSQRAYYQRSKPNKPESEGEIEL